MQMVVTHAASQNAQDHLNMMVKVESNMKLVMALHLYGLLKRNITVKLKKEVRTYQNQMLFTITIVGFCWKGLPS
jgi:hypothetical protein